MTPISLDDSHISPTRFDDGSYLDGVFLLEVNQLKCDL